MDEVAWYYSNNSPYGTKPVKGKLPNGYGLYDMSGNVWEWEWDWYGSYPSSAETNPIGPLGGSDRVLRGGGWGNGAEDCRSARRLSFNPGSRYDGVGLRLVLVP